jgi:hypothetical protein
MAFPGEFMKLAALGSIGLFAFAAAGVSPAAAGYPLHGTLPKEQNIILLCGVDAAQMAKDCGLPPGMPPAALTKRTQAFIDMETAAPDRLAGATPGSHVLVMIRVALGVPLDASNPGRTGTPAQPGATPVVDPNWAIMPAQADVDGYFPDRALRTATSGTAAAQCTVGANGDLLGCWISAETPADMGFGMATLKLSTFIQMKPAAKDGSAAAGRPYALQAAFDTRTGRITLADAR